MQRVALVTGGSRGIGRAIVRRLAEDGFAVAINYVQNKEAAESLKDELRGLGYAAEVFCADVSDWEQVQRMADEISATLGSVSVLINNAGIAQQKLFTDITPSEWSRMMSVHIDGAYHTCRAFLPFMIRNRNGCIVNVSSMWGQVGASCEVHYSTAKAALIGMTKALAKEVGPSGVRVNCVAPGVIATDMMADFDDDTVRGLTEETPLGRLGTPEDVAQAIAFLVSDEASFVTGQVLAPNGGFII